MESSRLDDGLVARSGSQLLVDALQMGLHRIRRNPQCGGDVNRRQSGGEVSQHVRLSLREGTLILRGSQRPGFAGSRRTVHATLLARARGVVLALISYPYLVARTHPQRGNGL